jgi:hypothetical protein
MNTQHFGFSVKRVLPLIFLPVLALFYVCTSCTKKTSDDAVHTPPLSSLSEILNGTVISGNLISVQNEGFMVQYGKETKIFILEKLQNHTNEVPEDIKDADVLYCQYGLVISDSKKNQIWVYINNDEESHKKFETVKSRWKGSFRTSVISGSTRINLTEVS